MSIKIKDILQIRNGDTFEPLLAIKGEKGESGSSIDDATTSASTTWSSEKIAEMKSEFYSDLEDTKNELVKYRNKALMGEHRPILLNVFQAQPSGKNNSSLDITHDGNIIYQCENNYFYVIDYTNLTAPKVLKQFNFAPASKVDVIDTDGITFTNSGKGFMCRNCDFTSDYIYVAIRYGSGVTTFNTGETYGGIAIIDKTDYTVKKCVWTHYMSSRVVINGNMMVVGNQTKGITFYDITDRLNPTVSKQIEYDWANNIKKLCESQAGKFFSANGNTYYCNVGFAKGFIIYDVTNASNITEVVDYNVQADISSKFPTPNNRSCHAYEVIIDYPYAYFTIATQSTTDNVSDKYLHEGIVAYDLTNLSSPEYKSFAHIDEKDVETFNSTGDTKPTVIKKFKDNMLVTNYEKGQLLFLVSDDKTKVEYVGKYYITENSYALDIQLDKSLMMFPNKSVIYTCRI